MYKERLLFSKIESDKVIKILKNFDESKVPGIDDLSGIFLKDGASLLATPITQLKRIKRIPRTTVQSPSYHYVKSAGENST